MIYRFKSKEGTVRVSADDSSLFVDAFEEARSKLNLRGTNFHVCDVPFEKGMAVSRLEGLKVSEIACLDGIMYITYDDIEEAAHRYRFKSKKGTATVSVEPSSLFVDAFEEARSKLNLRGTNFHVGMPVSRLEGVKVSEIALLDDIMHITYDDIEEAAHRCRRGSSMYHFKSKKGTVTVSAEPSSLFADTFEEARSKLNLRGKNFHVCDVTSEKGLPVLDLGRVKMSEIMWDDDLMHVTYDDIEEPAQRYRFKSKKGTATVSVKPSSLFGDAFEEARSKLNLRGENFHVCDVPFEKGLPVLDLGRLKMSEILWIDNLMHVTYDDIGKPAHRRRRRSRNRRKSQSTKN